MSQPPSPYPWQDEPTAPVGGYGVPEPTAIDPFSQQASGAASAGSPWAQGPAVPQPVTAAPAAPYANPVLPSLDQPTALDRPAAPASFELYQPLPHHLPARPEASWSPQPVVQPVYLPPYPQPLPEHPSAIAAFVLGLLGIFFPITAPIAWILGASARSQVRQNPQAWRSGGLGTAGMVLGIVVTALWALFFGLIFLLIMMSS